MESWITTGPGDVPKAVRAQADWADVLAVIGGDGTLRTVATALVETGHDTPVMVVPAGGDNAAYRYLYGTADWRELAIGLRRGIDARAVELGRIELAGANPIRFVLGWSAGWTAERLRLDARRRFLPGAAIGFCTAARGLLRGPPIDGSVLVDGTPLTDGPLWHLAVGRGTWPARDFGSFPATRSAHGPLSILAVEDPGIVGAIELRRVARRGRLDAHPAVTTATGETVRVDGEAALSLELDGTPLETPVETVRISVGSASIRVAYPPGWR